MSVLEKSFRECITEVSFVAFNKQEQQFFFDSTPEQCCNFIWDKTCPTAIIVYINEYAVEQYKPVHSFKKKLTDIELARKYKKL